MYPQKYNALLYSGEPDPDQFIELEMTIFFKNYRAAKYMHLSMHSMYPNKYNALLKLK